MATALTMTATTVVFTEDTLDIARRAACESLGLCLPIVADQLATLRDRGYRREGSHVADAQASVRELRRSLDLLDALGWSTSKWGDNR